jgi:acyl carrier protein
MSDKKQMIDELKTIVKPYIQDEKAFEDMHEDTDFINDLKINSANLIDVILDIEDKYDIELDNESMDKMLNVKAALEIINTKISEK